MGAPLYGSDNQQAGNQVDYSKITQINPKIGGSNIVAPGDIAVDVNGNIITIPNNLWFIIPFVGVGLAATGGINGTSTYTQNQVVVWKFHLPNMVINFVTMNVTVLAAASHLAFAIYTLDGNTKLLDTGALSGAATGLIEAQLGTALTLQEGNYLIAFSQDSAAVLQVQSFLSAGNALMQGTVNGNAPNDIFTAANASAAGVMPATLGALTKFPIGTAWAFPGVKLHN